MTSTLYEGNTGFPKTTNQDFHNGEVFDKSWDISKKDFMNHKRTNPYSAYVNAMFNSGVFLNPSHD